MRTVAELEAVFLEAAREIQDGIDAAGAGYRKILPVIAEFAHRAYNSGGGGSVDDLVLHVGQERIKTDICGLLVAVGMGDVLVASQGKRDWKAEPDFAARLEAVHSAGHLTASRGREQPNAPPLSGYLYPGVKVHKQ